MTRYVCMCSPTTRLKRLVRHFGLQPKALVETITQNRGEAIAASAIGIARFLKIVSS